VTREQIIVLGVIVAAFVAGWLVHAVTGSRERPKEAPAAEPPAPADPDPVAGLRELDRAARTYVASLLLDERDALPAPPAERLAEEVGLALRDDAANESMLSIVGAGGESLLTERELDLTDWGFAYGVAWARARERDPSLPEDEIAREALRTAEAVFREYTAGTAEWNGEAGAAIGRSRN